MRDCLALEVEKVVTTETVTPTPTAPIATAEAAAPAVAVDNLTIKCVDVIEDIKLRASAKKVFLNLKKLVTMMLLKLIRY